MRTGSRILYSLVTFSAGVICAFAVSAIGQMPNNEMNQMEYFRQMFVSAIKEESLENDQVLASVPGAIECENIRTIKNCAKVALYYKQHPEALIRLTSTDGKVHSFHPHTPASFISLQMDPTPENALAHLEELEQQTQASLNSQNITTQAYYARGGFSSLDLSKVSGPQISLPDNVLKINAFVSSDNSNNAQINQLVEFRKKHPNVEVEVYLASGSNPNFVEDLQKKGLPGRVVSESDRTKLVNADIKNYPTIWIDYKNKSRRSVLINHQSAEMIEHAALDIYYRKEN